MVVALDTNPLHTSRAGIARYVRGLLHGFELLASPDLRIEPLDWPVDNFGYRQPQRALKTAYRELVWARCIAPRGQRALHADLLHSTNGPFMWPAPGSRHVVTVHDLAVLRHPERYRWWHRRSSARRLRKLDSADRVLCISRFTADEVLQLLHLPADRLEVVHNGGAFSPDSPPPPELLPDFAVPSEFFLFVGSLEPGKNLPLLRSAYLAAAEAGTRLPPLVIIGARWAGVAREGPPPPDWHYAGHIPDGVLVHLYRRALALVFPSKYEGFGLPIAEAMSLGCPVLCSRVASLPEVGGDAVCYVDLTPQAYREAMLRLVQEPGLREDLSRRGHSQALRFTWRRCAEHTLQVYQAASS